MTLEGFYRRVRNIGQYFDTKSEYAGKSPRKRADVMLNQDLAWFFATYIGLCAMMFIPGVPQLLDEIYGFNRERPVAEQTIEMRRALPDSTSLDQSFLGE